MRVTARLSTLYHVELSAVALFLNPTPEELALEVTTVLGQDSDLLEELLNEIEGMDDADLPESNTIHRESRPAA
jgi:hypothetical protein